MSAPAVDVLIAGGGPAGLATAIEARMRGLAATVIEPREGAIDKACGEGLMPGALPALARLGIDPPGFPLLGVSYRDATRRVDHLFGDMGAGRGVRRTTLHELLRERARELGVRFVEGKVDAIAQDAESVTAAGIRARYLIGADGLHSGVRRTIGVEKPVRGRKRFGIRQHFRMEPASDLIEVYWTGTVEAYVTPVGDGIVGISMLGVPGTDFDATIAGIPELAERTAGRERASALRGAGPFRQSTTHRVRGRVLLVGDASGYVDAITGEGLRLSFGQAQAAVDCIVADDPVAYERSWTALTRDFRVLTSRLVLAATSPVRGAIVPVAVAMPGFFGSTIDKLAR